PSLFDWDGDGLADLFVGNYGYYQYSFYTENLILKSVYKSEVAYFKNTGTANQPEFKLINVDFGNLGQYEKNGLVPTFGNLTNDLLPEMVTGESNGKLILLKNMGNGQLEIVDQNYFSIDVGEFSAPQLFDLDKDGLLDLVIGEKNGNLNYYKNQGTSSAPDFVFVTDSLGKVNVTDYSLSYYGYSTPCFFRTSQGETQLVVGSELGQIFYYKNIDGNLDGKFVQSDELASLLDTAGITFDLGIRTSAAIGEIKHDGKPEMIAGNYSGGLEYFNGYSEVLPGFAENRAKNETLIISPNPTSTGEIKIEGLLKNGIFQYEIFQANGTLALSGSVNYTPGNHVSVNISSLKTGIYFIRIFNSSQNLTAKFLVQ
ncbi:MAG TPA: T9SS type A sorting domain-containing protein, partial [Bacteroidales bacterium]